MIHQDHLLHVMPLLDDHGGPLFTTKGGSCTCGNFYVWADTSREIEAMHDEHVKYQKVQDEKAQAYQYAHEVNLHEFDPMSSGARCKGCSWQVTGCIDRSRQRDAFSNHLETVRREALKRDHRL